MPTVNPFQQPGRWYRGNTHSHSTESDGRLPIADRFAQYRDGGYDFLVLTDHRKVNDVSAHSRDGFLAISGSEVGSPGRSARPGLTPDPPTATRASRAGQDPRGGVGMVRRNKWT